MKDAELIEIPSEMINGLNKYSGNFWYAFGCTGEPENYKDFILVKLLSVCSCLLLKKDIPMYMPDKEDISIMEKCTLLFQRGVDTDELSFEFYQSQDEVLAKYYRFCEKLPYCLTLFGWELVESYSDYFYYGQNEKIVLDDVLGIERLSVYPDFLDGKKTEIEDSSDIDREIHIFTNKRLGKYMNYAMKHPVEQQLHTKIVENLSKIQNVWGTENVTHSNRPDGYEVAYVLLSDGEDYPTAKQTAFSANIDIFLPIYAENLEKLLDRAYALYPIESEENKNGKYRIDKNSNRDVIAS